MAGRVLVLVAALTVLASPHAAAARMLSATYEVASQNLTGSVMDPAGITSDGTLDYGGVRFNAVPGETSIDITISDAAGGAPYYVICQDADLDGVCGEVGEPRASGCGSGSLEIAPSGGDVTIFVGLQNAVAPSAAQQTVSVQPCGGAAALGTTGTVTARLG